MEAHPLEPIVAEDVAAYFEEHAEELKGPKGDTGATGATGPQGPKGDTGATPTISAAATVDDATGTPTVSVTKTGTDAAPEFTFAFTGLKGPKGDPGAPSYDDTEIKSEINDINQTIDNGVELAISIKNPIFKKNVVSNATYFVSTGFNDWSKERQHLYIVDNINGFNNGVPIGFLNASGSWAGYIYLNKTVVINNTTYRYAVGVAPANAVSGKPAYIVGNNTDGIDVNLWIVDVTDITVTDELLETIVKDNQKNINYIDLIGKLSSISNTPQEGSSSSKWDGKNVLFIGDSLTATLKYQKTVKNNLGINVYNHCKGGMGIVQCVDGENGAPPYDPDNFNAGTLYPLMASDVANKDLIVFYAGYNNRGTEDGAVGDCYDPNDSSQGRTIAGYMQYALNRIFEELANASNLTCRVLVVTVDCAGKYPYINADGYEQYPANSGQTMETMANIQKAVAAANNVPCLDLWHDSGINRHTWTVYGANPNAYIENPTDTSTPYPHNGDQLHKSNAGYQLIGDCITGAIIEHWGN
jgi:lysophospholipase L1-like esterase